MPREHAEAYLDELETTPNVTAPTSGADPGSRMDVLALVLTVAAC